MKGVTQAKARGSDIVRCIWDRVQSSSMLEDRVGVGGQVKRSSQKPELKDAGVPGRGVWALF